LATIQVSVAYDGQGNVAAVAIAGAGFDVGRQFSAIVTDSSGNVTNLGTATSDTDGNFSIGVSVTASEATLLAGFAGGSAFYVSGWPAVVYQEDLPAGVTFAVSVQ